MKGDNAAKLASGWTGSGTPPQAYYAALWEKTGTMTVQLIQDATVAVASLWQYAWTQAGLMTPLAVAHTPTLPDASGLFPNYPNPFNSSTTISFRVPESGHARVTVYTLLGQEVAVLFDGVAAGGTVHRVRFEAPQLATGMYVCRLQSNGWSEVQRLSLVR